MFGNIFDTLLKLIYDFFEHYNYDKFEKKIGQIKFSQ